MTQAKAARPKSQTGTSKPQVADSGQSRKEEAKTKPEEAKASSSAGTSTEASETPHPAPSKPAGSGPTSPSEPETGSDSSEDSSGERTRPSPLRWSWWVPQLNKSQRQKSCQRIAESSAPRSSYFVLILLSTLIAAYGLVSNSTATVIGAMIVAPLMGPILGLALGLVLGDTRMFRKSLLAEVSGVFLVIATGIVVGLLVGIEQIDFGASEIAGRTRPTLYDLAIGLAAGLAGAYCTVHPGLQASVAGVAIAVALVPPLAVTGLTTAGWMHGILSWKPAFGSFMLFFANFLTIEMAGASIFLATGFRHVKEGSPKADFRRTVLVKLILLILTGIFLTSQLHQLLRERYGLTTSRRTLTRLLKQIPGADLDSIEAELAGHQFTVRAVVGSRTDIRPELVSRFQDELEQAMAARMPGVETTLIIRTVSSTYAAAGGYLFEPRTNQPDPAQLRQQALENALRQAVTHFPGVVMENFQLPAREPESTAEGELLIPLDLTLISPYEFTPRLVGEFEKRLNASLSGQGLFHRRHYKLRVRTVLMKTTTSEDALAFAAPETRSAAERDEAAREETLRRLLRSSLETAGDLKVLQLHLREAEYPGSTPPLVQESPAPQTTATPQSSPPVPVASPSPTESPIDTADPATDLAPSPAPEPPIPGDAYVAQIELRSSKLVAVQKLREVRLEVRQAYREATGRDLSLEMELITTIGTELHLDAQVGETPDESTLEADEARREKLLHTLTLELQKRVHKIPGATLEGIPHLIQVGEEGSYRLFGVVTSPKMLTKKQLETWQSELLKASADVKSLELRLENRLGQTLQLAPKSRD